jgi:hypothetical protein
MTSAEANLLPWFEVPPPLVAPLISALRLANTALDAAFYDVGLLIARLFELGNVIETDNEASSAIYPVMSGFHEIGLDALSNPEGSILVVDARNPPYISRPFLDVEKFIHSSPSAVRPIRTVSITGVGSSALGSVAFAWNVSSALGEPVASIVPGYGLADAVEQALGGWFGFGLYGWSVKENAQQILSRTAPEIAKIGRALMMTAPGHGEAENGAPVFLRGSGSSDVLHAILEKLDGIERLYGHSKGALVIENAVRDLPVGVIKPLRITTFGCPIEERPPASYRQLLGCFDMLGQLNSWGRKPDIWILTGHTTNTLLPLSIKVDDFALGWSGN